MGFRIGSVLLVEHVRNQVHLLLSCSNLLRAAGLRASEAEHRHVGRTGGNVDKVELGGEVGSETGWKWMSLVQISESAERRESSVVEV